MFSINCCSINYSCARWSPIFWNKYQLDLFGPFRRGLLLQSWVNNYVYTLLEQSFYWAILCSLNFALVNLDHCIGGSLKPVSRGYVLDIAWTYLSCMRDGVRCNDCFVLGLPAKWIFKYVDKHLCTQIHMLMDTHAGTTFFT